jgi:uncharacterized protein YdiU (UPF0061 family)
VAGPAGGWEIQLKGAGQTPYSRFADGRAVLRSSIREFLCSEAMAGLGIPTTRALCVVGSNAPVRRETIETAAVVTRLAPSFIRFGSFEHWRVLRQMDELRQLADYVIDRFRPECRDAANPYDALLRDVGRRTGELIAHWQAVGFMHGVMNTDNMSILGLTLDYGPFGFMDAFDAGHICNHSDDDGRYSYKSQPQIGHWNLYALGRALAPLIGEQAAVQAAIEESYAPAFEDTSWPDACQARPCPALPGDEDFIGETFGVLQQHHPDYTQFFRQLGRLPGRADAAGPGATDAPVRDLHRPRRRRRVARAMACPPGRGRPPRRRAPGRHAGRQSEVRAAQLDRRVRHPGGPRGRLQRSHGRPRLPVPSLRRTTRVRTLRRRPSRLG